MRIAGVGCSLMDFLYPNVSFESPAFRRYQSVAEGDGGLSIGKLVFRSDLERFSGTSLPHILDEVAGAGTARAAPVAANLGGPSIVALIGAAQLLADPETVRTLGAGCGGQTDRDVPASVDPPEIAVEFFGARGDDDTGARIMRIISATTVEPSGYVVLDGTTPSTTVLSDPGFDAGHGERTFVNDLGAAALYSPGMVPDRFFSADIAVFGGTALVPTIHEHIDTLLSTAKREGAFTVVNTVYDFRNQQRDPAGRWPFGRTDRSFSDVDLFIADLEEARRITGQPDGPTSLEFLRSHGVRSAIITCGTADTLFYPEKISLRGASDGLSRENGAGGPGRSAVHSLPVCDRVRREVSAGTNRGDTTGCGDNFVGGVIASLAARIACAPERRFDLRSACAVGTVCGGFACFYVGGTCLETVPGEKQRKMSPYFRGFADQLRTLAEGTPQAVGSSELRKLGPVADALERLGTPG